MRILDWLVIAGYAVGMLAIGRYYARRNKTADDYMLGSRRISPFAVGLSLFATLTSALSYLAVPGEMITVSYTHLDVYKRQLIVIQTSTTIEASSSIY